MDLRQQAEEILAALGGKENIQAATHCVTRLRLALADEGKVDKEALQNIDVVKGSFSANNQYQVVIGQGTVDKVYKEFIQIAEVGESTKDEVKETVSKKGNPLQRALKTLGDIFIPILPAIVTAGLLLGIHNILNNPGIFFDSASIIEVYPQWAGIADMIYVIANTAFAFLPALIGWSAVKKFGGSPLLGMVLGLALIHPSLLNPTDYASASMEGNAPVWNLFGLEIQRIGYQGQVLPVLFAAWVLAKIEIFLRRKVPDSFQLLVVAPVALLLTGIISFIVIGPIMFIVGNAITDGFVAVFDTVAPVGGLLYGALYGALVVTGLHHTFLALDLQLIANTGATFLWPILALSNISQGSATLGVMLATKDEKLRGLSLTAWISAWLGVTEPAVFGVNLRFRYPFFLALGASAVAGTFIAWRGVEASSVGIGGVPGIFSILPGSWGAFAIGMVIVIVVPFVTTYLVAKRKKNV
ncbi:PTS system trehalose-specific EIIBC component [Terribacillus saccharophilus]|uniref:PTS system trehalose-specific EIIBC component n=1 Tax=Terribacillus saccharophilus TaxID=361277 RepID=UPI000C9C7CD0|nr:PTS system trehalose-specific EIIBC component [Terribacillus goriensis]